MKKLELKNLKVKKLTFTEKLNIQGGIKNSSTVTCPGNTSDAPITCSSEKWNCGG